MAGKIEADLASSSEFKSQPSICQTTEQNMAFSKSVPASRRNSGEVAQLWKPLASLTLEDPLQKKNLASVPLQSKDSLKGTDVTDTSGSSSTIASSFSATDEQIGFSGFNGKFFDDETDSVISKGEQESSFVRRYLQQINNDAGKFPVLFSASSIDLTFKPQNPDTLADSSFDSPLYSYRLCTDSGPVAPGATKADLEGINARFGFDSSSYLPPGSNHVLSEKNVSINEHNPKMAGEFGSDLKSVFGASNKGYGLYNDMPSFSPGMGAGLLGEDVGGSRFLGGMRNMSPYETVPTFQQGLFSNAIPDNNSSVCRFYQVGYCTRGGSCSFQHVNSQMGSGMAVNGIENGPMMLGSQFPRHANPQQLQDSVMVPSFVPVGGLQGVPGAGYPNTMNLYQQQPAMPLQAHNAPTSLYSYQNPGSNGFGVGYQNQLGNAVNPALNGIYSTSGFAIPGMNLTDMYNSSMLNSQGKKKSKRASGSGIVAAPMEDANRYAGIALEDLAKEIPQMCKDQHGCRYLQKKLEEGKRRQTNLIFSEVSPHIVELMTDPFGNYLCQKLLEFCGDDQRTSIVETVATDLVQISLNMHGTRAVQKLIEFMSNAKQISIVVNVLSPHVVTLIKDLNGNHVIQKCLNRLTSQDNQFIYNAVAENCVEVATHRHGCCVMQRCIDHAADEQKIQLAKEITKKALELVQDPFGNYVVQYILDLGEARFNDALIRRFLGHISTLSIQKFSSNVIERCIRVAEDETRRLLIDEIMQRRDRLDRMLRDPYGNYVVQTALDFAENTQRTRLVDTLRPLLPGIRNTPYGKRIQGKLFRVQQQQMNGPSAQLALMASTQTGVLGNGGFGYRYEYNNGLYVQPIRQQFGYGYQTPQRQQQLDSGLYTS